ncbi:hypothetical protein FHW36_104108 [Chitinophaga polysaccharea]|uniref:Uncharacterized protein n=1 Tax=Chitinophaga polysaccharea TaxID=1293035 RepID=A0A561PQM6_9BACT|nr:hypothetical protein [Chitinophaga polysaccharea]TWF40426.1 hypothetical protein FHW36_104108 [Chitinophaga polysaccharea]
MDNSNNASTVVTGNPPATTNGTTQSPETNGKKLQPLLVVILGLIAFMGAFKLILNGENEQLQFHEINWNTRQVLNNVIDSSLQDSTAVLSLVQERQKLQLLPQADTRLRALKDSLVGKQRDALLKIRGRIAVMNDTELQQFSSKSLRIDSLDLRLLKKMNGHEISQYQQPVTVVFCDSTLQVKEIRKKITLTAIPYDSDRFMVKYPVFGYWIISLIVQATLYCLLIPYLLSIIFRKNNGEHRLSVKWKIIYVVIVIAVCVSFYFLFLNAPSDEDNIVRNELFMHNLHTVFTIINSLGYFTAALCLSGMLFTFSDTRALLSAKSAPTYLSDLLSVNNDFKVYFVLAALILTFAVIATGQFYAALNTLSFVKAYNLSIGYDYFRLDVVYFYGILHTFLLLLFYIPVQLQLAEANAEVAAQAVATGAGDAARIGKTFEPAGTAKKIIDLLVVGSPMIAAFVKNLVDLVFS